MVARRALVGDDSAMAGESVIVVDDDAALRTLVADYLAAQGFAVRPVSSAAEMRAAHAAAPADLVILDIMMPGEDGLSALRALGGDDRPAVILLSTLAADVDRIVGLELGADDYVGKPCNPRELLARVRAVLRRRSPAPAPAQSGHWHIDTQGWRVSAPDGTDVALTDSELRLFLALAKASGRVLNRDYLIDAIGNGEEVFDRSVDVHISRLRQKLSASGGACPLRTVRGQGYAMAADVRVD